MYSKDLRPDGPQSDPQHKFTQHATVLLVAFLASICFLVGVSTLWAFGILELFQAVPLTSATGYCAGRVGGLYFGLATKLL